jgi:hypothetical protein
MIFLYLTISSILFGLAQALRYARWKYMLTAIPGWEFNRTFRGFILGQFFNIFVPFKIGDLIRAGTSARKLDSVFLIFLTLVGERILDATYLFFILFVGLDYNSDLLKLFGIISIFAFTLAASFNFFLKKFIVSNFKQTKIRDFILISFSIIGNSLKQGLKFKTSWLTLGMWLCNLCGVFILTKNVTISQSTNKIVDVLYLSLSSPYLNLNFLMTLSLIGSILFALLFIHSFRITKLGTLIEINLRSEDSNSGSLSLHQLAIVLTNMEKNEKIIETFNGGSGATTLLIERMNKQEFFVRKYVVSENKVSLLNQFEILSSYKSDRVIAASNLRQSYNSISFDMPYLEGYVTFTDFLLNQPKSCIESTTKLILEHHRNVFRETENQSKVKINWDSYIDQRVNPEFRLLPALRKFISVYPEKNQKILYLYGQIEEFYKVHLESFTRGNLTHNLIKCHGDFSTSNIMLGKDSNVVFIDLVNQKEHSSILNDYAKLHFSLTSGFDTTNLALSKFANWPDAKVKLPNLVTTSNILAVEVLENYLQLEVGLEMLKSVEFLSPLHTLRVLPYRLEQDASNTENWLDWAIEYFSGIRTL